VKNIYTKTDPAVNEARQAARAEKRERAKDVRLVALMAAMLHDRLDLDAAIGRAFTLLQAAKDATRKD